MPSSQKDWAVVRAAREALAALHPHLFDLDRPAPLAVGIYDQLATAYPKMPIGLLKGLLGWLTCRRSYLKACTPGATRYGLNGPDGAVTAVQAKFAATLFAARDARARDKWADRMAA